MNPDPSLLLWPTAALALWTMSMFMLMAARRVRAMRSGDLEMEDFAIGEPVRTPNDATLAHRNYLNLLELPVLFYAACAAAMALGAVTTTMVVIAWCYVVARVVHSLIHVSYNKVAHRFAAFATSNGALMVLWVLLLVRAATTTTGG